MPAHENLYEGVHERLTELIDWHEVALEKLYELCAVPKRAVDVFPALFKSDITDTSFFPATGESIAHLIVLLNVVWSESKKMKME